MAQRYRAMVLASFAGDALALGAHWIYDTDKLISQLGRVEEFLSPSPDSYHSGKADGQFTHYGDQTLLLLKTLNKGATFDLEEFGANWRRFMENYDGYMDKATTETLANFKEGRDAFNSGSASTDLGGPARMAPLLYHFRSDQDLLLSYVREQTAMTHNSQSALLAAELLCRLCWNVLNGARPAEAVLQLLEDGINDITLEMRIRNALESGGDSTTAAIKASGQACGAEQALPGVVHLITAYEDNLEEALIENVMAGGDSAARGLATGMILGAHLGMEAIPQRWLREMVSYDTIVSLLDTPSPAQNATVPL